MVLLYGGGGTRFPRAQVTHIHLDRCQPDRKDSVQFQRHLRRRRRLATTNHRVIFFFSFSVLLYLFFP